MIRCRHIFSFQEDLFRFKKETFRVSEKKTFFLVVVVISLLQTFLCRNVRDKRWTEPGLGLDSPGLETCTKEWTAQA